MPSLPEIQGTFPANQVTPSGDPGQLPWAHQTVGLSFRPFGTRNTQNKPFLCQAFEFAFAEIDIEHRLTKPRHPWTNGQVERMNRTIKDATVKRFHYESHGHFRQHLADFVAAYNSPAVWRPCEASHHTKLSAKPGRMSRPGSPMTRTTKSQDQTSSQTLPRING